MVSHLILRRLYLSFESRRKLDKFFQQNWSVVEISSSDFSQVTLFLWETPQLIVIKVHTPVFFKISCTFYITSETPQKRIKMPILKCENLFHRISVYLSSFGTLESIINKFSKHFYWNYMLHVTVQFCIWNTDVNLLELNFTHLISDRISNLKNTSPTTVI